MSASLDITLIAVIFVVGLIFCCCAASRQRAEQQQASNGAMQGRQQPQQQQASNNIPMQHHQRQPASIPVVVVVDPPPTPAMRRPQQRPQQQQTPNSIPAVTAIVVKFDTINNQTTEAKYFSNDICAICLAEFKKEDSCKILYKCKHLYHQECIDLWLEKHRHCPLCRASVGGATSRHRN